MALDRLEPLAGPRHVPASEAGADAYDAGGVGRTGVLDEFGEEPPQAASMHWHWCVGTRGARAEETECTALEIRSIPGGPGLAVPEIVAECGVLKPDACGTPDARVMAELAIEVLRFEVRLPEAGGAYAPDWAALAEREEKRDIPAWAGRVPMREPRIKLLPDTISLGDLAILESSLGPGAGMNALSGMLVPAIESAIDEPREGPAEYAPLAAWPTGLCPLTGALTAKAADEALAPEYAFTGYAVDCLFLSAGQNASARMASVLELLPELVPDELGAPASGCPALAFPSSVVKVLRNLRLAGAALPGRPHSGIAELFRAPAACPLAAGLKTILVIDPPYASILPAAPPTAPIGNREPSGETASVIGANRTAFPVLCNDGAPEEGIEYSRSGLMEGDTELAGGMAEPYWQPVELGWSN